MLTATGSIIHIDDKISHYQRILLSIPRHHPSHFPYLQLLGSTYFNRYVQSRQKKDLDRSILTFTEAILIAPPWHINGQNIVQTFFLLAQGLFVRLDKFDQSSDAPHCAAYFRYLRSQPLETFGIPCNIFDGLFLSALASQLEGSVGDVSQNIDEMTAHCRELLASNIQQPDLERAARAVISASQPHRKRSSLLEDSEEVVKFLREVNRRLESHEFANALAFFLCRRFDKSCSLDDYNEAITLFDKITSSEPNGDSPGRYFKETAYNTVALVCNRAYKYQNAEYIEEAIYRCQEYLRIPDADEFDRDIITSRLAMFMEKRSNRFGVVEGLQEARSRDPEATYVPSFSCLAKSLLDKSTTDNTHWWAEQRELQEHIRALAYVGRTTDIAEIEETIKYCRLLLAQCRPNDPLISVPAFALGKILFHAFECTDKIEYLDESIAVFRRILEMSIAKGDHFRVIQRLLVALSIRFSPFRDNKGFDECMRLFSAACNDTYTSVSDRFLVSRCWTDNARRNGHQTTSTAYDTAMSLMQDALLFAPTLETQHFNLVALRDAYEELPPDIASYEVDRGRLKEAIQALERGRALIWSELRGLRTSIHQPEVGPHLAEEFTAVNRDLETLTTSISSGTVTMNGNDRLEAGTGTGMDKFGRVVIRHRELLAKRNELVSKIRSLPGLEGFSKTPSFDTLRSAAAHGPVVIINHSKWRSDILIVLHDAHPSLITTTDNFYNHAIELRNRLLHTRTQYPLESKQYKRALRFVLKGLYELVGKPVIEELRRLEIPEQSRIWWCPTSVFCSLPLHAMGPILSIGGVPCYFSDLYIPSYTPTLSALIEARKNGRLSSEKPSVLLVANPDDAMEQAWPEIWFIQGLDTKVTTLLGKMAKPSAVLEGLQDHQFAHFVCHGNLVPEKPFDASFGLHEGNRLTLLDLVRSRLPTAEFAFLSACHTAELTEGSIADEGLHLTAAVQYCGFRSVVGTMWAMADQDGGDLTELFYTSMFSSGEAEVPYHERSAKALRDAVRSLRKKKGVPLEQWVNFVHYGT